MAEPLVPTKPSLRHDIATLRGRFYETECLSSPSAEILVNHFPKVESREYVATADADAVGTFSVPELTFVKVVVAQLHGGMCRAIGQRRFQERHSSANPTAIEMNYT